MNYENMSDLEVNERTAKCIGGFKGYVGEHLPSGVKVKDFEFGFGYQEVDYCNNWQDIGPLIESYQIDVGFIDGFGWTAEQRGQHTVSVYDNPKRAAAICIIKLLESQK